MLKIEKNHPVPQQLSHKKTYRKLLNYIPLDRMSSGESVFVSEEAFESLIEGGGPRVTHPILSIRSLIGKLCEDILADGTRYGSQFVTRSKGYTFVDGEPYPDKGSSPKDRGVRVWRR